MCRTECVSCGSIRGGIKNIKVIPQPHQREGDWTCPNCKDLNFASRVVCRRCSAPKPADPKVVTNYSSKY
jgi:hypothetical protein